MNLSISSPAFTGVPGSNVKNKYGSGLGLYICRKLMNRMDGEVFAKRLEDGMSVTAVFRLRTRAE